MTTPDPGPSSNISVLYHAECLDGFGAAWAAWKALGAEAHYQPVRHGDPPPEMPPGAVIYLLDFCYPPDRLVQLATQAERVVVLDHHESAQKAFERSLQDGLESPPNLYVHFDMAYSGCVLAWHHFHPNQPLPPVLAHIEDRDLWRHELPGTREINQALFLRLPIPFEEVEPLSLRELEQEGKVLCRQQQQSVQRLMKSRHKVRVGECEGLAVNAPLSFASDLGEALAIESGTFGLIYQFHGQRQRWECSLRSQGEFDVAALATRFGGGGHRNAAGFILEASAALWRGVVELPSADLTAELPPEAPAASAPSQETPDSPETEPAPQRLAETGTLLDQVIALTVEYQHPFDPYRGASKRAYLIAAERFSVTRQRVQDAHAGCQDWLANLTDDDLKAQLQALQTSLGLGVE